MKHYQANFIKWHDWLLEIKIYCSVEELKDKIRDSLRGISWLVRHIWDSYPGCSLRDKEIENMAKQGSLNVNWTCTSIDGF